MTLEELLEKYPGGFAVGPGGDISKIIFATSHFAGVARNYPIAPSRGGYFVVEMVPNEDFVPLTTKHVTIHQDTDIVHGTMVGARINLD